MVCLSQLSRLHQRESRRPNNYDLRESGGIEQSADSILLLYMEDSANLDSRGIMELICSKNRHGPTGVTFMKFNKEIMRFADLSRETYDKERAKLDGYIEKQEEFNEKFDFE